MVSAKSKVAGYRLFKIGELKQPNTMKHAFPTFARKLLLKHFTLS
jgi:hypothetical protein